MQVRTPGFEIMVLSKTIRRYLAMTLPASARIATRDNAQIITFLARNEGRDVFQHDVETHFGITRSTASRVLSLMERKALITRSSVDYDARLKKITLTDTAKAIVRELEENANRMEKQLFAGFSAEETNRFEDYMDRLRANIATAEREAHPRGASVQGMESGTKNEEDDR